MQKTIEFKDFNELMYVLGPEDKNIKQLRKQFGVKIWVRGHTLVVEGKISKVALVEQAINDLREPLTKKKIEKKKQKIEELTGKYPPCFVTYKYKHICPRTARQNTYVENIRKNDIVFGIGPAGTGKTFLAVALAINKLTQGLVERIIITRPVMEAGEKLGFLPGDLTEKMNPYVKPLEDAFMFLIGIEKYAYYRDTGVIEIVPLAYMRGRTLENAFVILDEGQNATENQMFMFLTRMGENSQVVINGDVTQIDLPIGVRSGLVQAEDILKRIRGISFVYFSNHDVVRHPLVKRIVREYSILRGK